MLSVCLQPFDFDPNEKNRHKFMVQSLVAPEGDFNAEQLVRINGFSIRLSFILIIYISACFK